MAAASGWIILHVRNGVSKDHVATTGAQHLTFCTRCALSSAQRARRRRRPAPVRPAHFRTLLSPRAVRKLICRPSVTWSISLRRVDSLRAPEPRAHVFTLVPPAVRFLDVDFQRKSVEHQMSVINPFLGGSVAESVVRAWTSRAINPETTSSISEGLTLWSRCGHRQDLLHAMRA